MIAEDVPDARLRLFADADRAAARIRAAEEIDPGPRLRSTVFESRIPNPVWLPPLDTQVEHVTSSQPPSLGWVVEWLSALELLQGTLDLIPVLRAPSTMGPQHAYGLASRLEQVAEIRRCSESGHAVSGAGSASAIERLDQRGRGSGPRATVRRRTTPSRRRVPARSTSRRNGGVGWRGALEKLLLNES